MNHLVAHAPLGTPRSGGIAATAAVVLASLLTATSPGDAAEAAPPGQATTITLAGDSFGDGLDASKATLIGPRGMAAGPDGIYISDTSHYQVRLLRPNGMVDRVAGSSVGFSGDGGDATEAQLNRPRGLAFDRDGNLLITDSGNNRIRRVNLATGVITTVAGDGSRTYGGDGGPATQASLAFPYDVTADRFGNIYIADFENSRIRRVTPSGTMETLAGQGNRDVPVQAFPNDADGVPASTATVKPTAVLADDDGNLYFGDQVGCRVRMIDRATRTVTTIAGDGCGSGGDGGPALAARFSTIYDLAFDPQGRLVIAEPDNQRIRRIETDGTVSTIVGDGNRDCPSGPSPANGPAGIFPMAVTFDANAVLHYASEGCSRTYTVDGDVIRPAVGRSGSAPAGDSGDPATSMEFRSIRAVAWGPGETPYFADARGIWKITSDGRGVLVAGGEPGDADGPALDAKFELVTGMAFDDAGALWIADLGAGRIKRLDGGIVQTMAGDPSAPDETTGTDGPALQIQLQGVIDVAPHPDGAVYFNEATEVGERVRRLEDGRLTLVAGQRETENRFLQPIGDGGPAADAIFRYLRGLTLAPDGSLLAVDSSHHRIRRIAPDGTIDTVAGDGGEQTRGDGTIAELASFSTPEDVAVDAAGNMFITDGKNEYSHQDAQYTIRHVAPNGMVSTIAGTGETGSAGTAGTVSLSGAGGSGPSLQFPLSNPQALALGPKGLLVADTTAVRLIEPPAGGWPSPPRVIRCDPYFPDVEGDARPELGPTSGPSQSWQDLLDADVREDGTNLTVSFQVLDLNERVLAPPNQIGVAYAWYYRFMAGDSYKYVAAYSPYRPGATEPPRFEFEYGTTAFGRGASSYTVTRSGAATGSFDMAKDRVTITAPLTGLGITPGTTVWYHEAIAGALVEVASLRYITDDDTTSPGAGFLPGTARSFMFGKRCPGDF